LRGNGAQSCTQMASICCKRLLDATVVVAHSIQHNHTAIRLIIHTAHMAPHGPWAYDHIIIFLIIGLKKTLAVMRMPCLGGSLSYIDPLRYDLHAVLPIHPSTSSWKIRKGHSGVEPTSQITTIDPTIRCVPDHLGSKVWNPKTRE
jgi:hypothetical protein